jgi:DNA-binding transcriptional ArsR family regulator
VAEPSPIEVHKALADDTRYRLYRYLRLSGRAVTVRELSTRLGLHVNTLRPHLRRLEEAGLVRSEALRGASVGRPQTVYAAIDREAREGRDYRLFADIVRARSSLVARVKDNVAFTVAEERSLAETDLQAGVLRDVVLARLGTAHHRDPLKRPMRLVIVRVPARDGVAGRTEDLWLITDRLDLSADLVALAYRYRWTVELFFRWLKCVLGARHLIGHKPRSVTWQMYAALIVSLLLVLYTGRKPTKRTFEAVQFYLVDWVSDEELQRHLLTLQPIAG